MADGTIISDGSGHFKILKGNQWVDYSGPAAKGAGGKGIPPQAQKFLNDLSTQAAAAGETRRIYENAKGAVNRLDPGPWRGRFLDMAIPTEGGGALDSIGAAVVGGPAKLLGAITPQNVDDYQYLKGLQSEQVLGKQLLQKGPQTESDAARLQLTEISPSKSRVVNEKTIEQGTLKADRIRAKAAFYAKFANKWGLNGTTPHGYTADQLWSKGSDQLTKQMFAPKSQDATIKVLSVKRIK